MKLLAKSAIVLALLASILSFAKFDHCRNFGWGTPDDYVHACYSDLPALFSERQLSTHQWPYSSASNSVEYPPITGVVMYATSFLVKHDSNQYRSYFDINAILIGLLFIGSVIFLKKLKPEFWYLFPLAPAVIASLYINWDLWAVLPAIAAIYYFDLAKYKPSAIFLAISIATKFFPIVLLLPILLIFWRKKEIQSGARYFGTVVTVWLGINLPFILTTPAGWYRFFKLNADRGADWGSVWHGLQVLGLNLKQLNFLSSATFILGVVIFSYAVLRMEQIPKLAAVSFYIVAIFVTASKVYSPQYVLWLTPLAIMALYNKKELFTFWIWQGGEIIYHLAIWQYLASYSGAHFGIPAKAYAVAIFIRVGLLFWFANGVFKRLEKLDKQAQSTPEITPQEPQFRPSGVGGYA